MARDVQRNRERRTRGGALKQLPWRNYRNPYKPIEVLRGSRSSASMTPRSASSRSTASSSWTPARATG